MAEARELLEGADLVAYVAVPESAGQTSRIIAAPDAVRANAHHLAIKLIPYEGRLVGGVLASAERPGTILPYVISLTGIRA